MAERTARSRDWFQIMSNVAIIIGLGLVIYELNQSKQLVVAQMAQDYVDRMAGQKLALLGDDPRQSFARAALHPAELNPSDAVALATFYEALVINWTSMHRTGEILGVDRGWKEMVAGDTRQHFSTAPGRRWLKAWIDEASVADRDRNFDMLNEITEVAKKTAENETGNYYRTQYELLLAKD
jgi:hypothetical protein